MKLFKKSNPFWIQPQKYHTNANIYYDLGYKECLNISFVNPQYNYIIYSKEYSFFKFERLTDTSGYISWSEASELCRDIGGYLPYFTSREQLDKLLALLKLSSEIYPIEALYIGLTSNAMVMLMIVFSKPLYLQNKCNLSSIYSEIMFLFHLGNFSMGNRHTSFFPAIPQHPVWQFQRNSLLFH